MRAKYAKLVAVLALLATVELCLNWLLRGDGVTASAEPASAAPQWFQAGCATACRAHFMGAVIEPAPGEPEGWRCLCDPSASC